MTPRYNIPTNFTPTLDYIDEQEGIDADLFERMISAESNFNKKVTGLEDPVAELPSFSPNKYADVEITTSRLPSATGRSQDLSRVAQEITALEEVRRSALENMRQRPELDTDQAIAMALTAIIPTLLGWGYGGLQGAGMGAAAGAAGANVGLQAMAQENQQRQQANNLLYRDITQQLARKEAERSSIQKEMRDREERNQELEFLEAGRNRRSGQMAGAIRGKDERSGLQAGQVDKIAEYVNAVQSANNFISRVQKEMPDLANETYRREDGSFDVTRLPSAVRRKLEGYFGGINTQSGKFEAAKTGFMLDLQKALSGLAVTESESKRIESMLSGGLTPASVSEILAEVEAIRDRNEQQAMSLANLYPTLNKIGDKPSDLANFFKQRRPQLNTSAAPRGGLSPEDITKEARRRLGLP